jgi:hypothetical protein
MLPTNIFACRCGFAEVNPDKAMAHIKACNGPMAVYDPDHEPTVRYHEPKGPGEVQVHEGAVLYLSSDGKVGFPVVVDGELTHS